MPTTSLRTFLPPLRCEVEPLAFVHADGRIRFESAAFPPLGACVFALWRPGGSPAFWLARVEVRREGRSWVASPAQEGWVVAWAAASALGT